MMRTNVARSRFGAYSLVNAIALGAAGPSAIPVSSRTMKSTSTDSTNTVSSVSTLKAVVAAMIIVRCPMRSASGEITR